MLGHTIPFSYCKLPGSDMPCRRILDCWHERFDILTYLNEILTPDELAAITAPPKPKVMHLLELIQRAKGKQEPE
jgi:hypothetical protein